MLFCLSLGGACGGVGGAVAGAAGDHGTAGEGEGRVGGGGGEDGDRPEAGEEEEEGEAGRHLQVSLNELSTSQWDDFVTVNLICDDTYFIPQLILQYEPFIEYPSVPEETFPISDPTL